MKTASLTLGGNVARLLDETPALHDGKWLCIPVSDPLDTAEVQT